MLHHCDDCLNISVAQQFIKDQLLIMYTSDCSIKYKQWISTDRSQLADKEEEFEDFV